MWTSINNNRGHNSKYRECDLCKSNLDWGERCGCDGAIEIIASTPPSSGALGRAARVPQRPRKVQTETRKDKPDTA